MTVSLAIYTTLDISNVSYLNSSIKWFAIKASIDTLRHIHEGIPGKFFTPDNNSFPEAILQDWDKGGIVCEIPEIDGFLSLKWNYGNDKNTPYWPNCLIVDFDILPNNWSISFSERFLMDGLEVLDGFFAALLMPQIKPWGGGRWGLTAGLQQIPHLTVFGREYIALLGRSKIINAPVFSVTEKDQAIAIRLFNNLPTSESVEWKNKQNELQAYFGRQFFGRAISPKPSRMFSVFDILNVSRMVAEFWVESRSPRNVLGGPVAVPMLDWNRMKSR